MYVTTLRFMVVLGGGTSVLLHSVEQLGIVTLQYCSSCDGKGRRALPKLPNIRALMNAALAIITEQDAEGQGIFREMVAKQMGIRRQELVAWMVPRITHILAVTLAICIFQTVNGENRWISWQQDVVFVIVSWSLIARQRCVWLARATGPFSLASFLLFAWTAWVALATPIRPVFVMCSALSVGPRFLCSAIFMRRTPTILWNAFHIVVATLTYTKLVDGKCSSLSMSQIVTLEVVTAMMVIAGSEAIRSEVLRSVCAELENVETKSGCSAAVALLNTVCDASAKLDENLLISEDAPRLEALLLHSPGRSLKGVKFSKLLASEEDREKFLTRACERANLEDQENALADWFHVHVRDNTNNKVEVEVFMVSFTSYSNRTNFLVGICEKAADTVVRKRRVPAAVSFDASTFEVVSRSSGFDLRGPNGSCQIGDCLRTWLVPCSDNDGFFYDMRMGTDAVKFANKQLSFASTVVLRDLVKPGTAYAAGHCFLVQCSVSVRSTNVGSDKIMPRFGSESSANSGSATSSFCCAAATDMIDESSGGVSAEAAERLDSSADGGRDGVAESHGLYMSGVSSKRRIIATMKLNDIERIRTCRGDKHCKPQPLVTESFWPTPSVLSDRSISL